MNKSRYTPTMMKSICPLVDKSLQDFFRTTIVQSNKRKCVTNNFNVYCTYVLDTYLKCPIEQKEVAEKKRELIREQRKIKLRWTKKFKTDIQKIQKNSTEVAELMNFGSNPILSSIEAWCDNSSSLITSYPLISGVTDRRLITGFDRDLALNLANIIIKKIKEGFFIDKPKVGTITSSKVLVEAPLFSQTKGKQPFVESCVDDTVIKEVIGENGAENTIVYNDYHYGETILRTIVELGINVFPTKVGDQYILPKLDPKDLAIIDYVTQEAGLSLYSFKPALIDIKKLAAYINPQVTRVHGRYYDEAEKRLFKLSYTRFVRLKQDAENQVQPIAGTKALIDSVEFATIDGVESDHILEVHMGISFIKSLLKNKVELLLDDYNKLDQADRLFFQAMQQDRIEVLCGDKENLVREYTIDWFKSRIQLDKSFTKSNKFLLNLFEKFMKNGLLLKRYRVLGVGIYEIEYLPFSDKEYEVYTPTRADAQIE